MPDITQLFMRRPNLDGLPAIPDLPAGYEMRTFRDGEEEPLCAMLAAAFPEIVWNIPAVHRELLECDGMETIYVIAHEGKPVATATARYVPDWYPDSQYVHWVGVEPSHRGKQLGKWLTVRVMEHGRAAGRRDVVLETDDFRIPAIKVYLNLGYIPECRRDGDEERWRAVGEVIGRPLQINK
jgi:mycothiol synthase